MKHVLLIVFALVLLVLGFGVIVATFMAKAALTTSVLIFSGSCVLVSMALAIPAQLLEAKATLVDVSRAVKDSLFPPAPPSGGAA